MIDLIQSSEAQLRRRAVFVLLALFRVVNLASAWLRIPESARLLKRS